MKNKEKLDQFAGMNMISATELHRYFHAIMRKLRQGHAPYLVTKHGKPVVILKGIN